MSAEASTGLRWGASKSRVRRLQSNGGCSEPEPIPTPWRRNVVENTLFVGVDVHKKTISVATVDGCAGSAVRFYGTVENTPDAIRALCKNLSKDGGRLHACSEAGAGAYN